MAPIRPDPLGIMDLGAGILLFFTLSPLPAVVANVHAFFLIFKGSISMIKGFPPILPVYVLGGAADILSAAILATGRPPVLGEYKLWIAGFLFLKGVWSLLGFMQG